MKKRRLPVGYEDFKRIIDEKLYYIDKSMFILELINDRGSNNLITRPRRFGKTLNFSMLRYFFDITEKDNAYLFDGLKISEYYNKIEQYRNAYPVITLSLKGAKQGNYRAAMRRLKSEIQQQFIDNKFILSCDRIEDENKNEYCRILDLHPDADWGVAIKLLSVCLKQYYGVNAIILIDEYDVPLEDAYFSGYYDEMVGFIRSLFESTLKTNPALEFSVITGCLRVSKESIFTGLNNLEVNTILSPHYSDAFVYTQQEIDNILAEYDITDKRDELKRWYDGYLFCETEVYNPWSVINQVKLWLAKHDAYPVASWINSSSNSIIRELVNHADKDTREMIENLMSGGSVEAVLNETVTYGDLTAKSENIWSFLFFTGYLKLKSSVHIGDETTYSLIIPNVEIRQCYKHIILEYFNTTIRDADDDKLYEALLSKDTDSAAKQLNDLMKRTMIQQ